MRREREAGFTLLEVLFALVLTTILLGVTHGVIVQTVRVNCLARDYATDVLGARGVLEAIERDIRAARRVEAGAGLKIETAEGKVTYRLAGQTLERVEAGRIAPLARNIAAFASGRDGALVRISIELGKRSGEATRRPLVSGAVRIRCEEAVR